MAVIQLDQEIICDDFIEADDMSGLLDDDILGVHVSTQAFIYKYIYIYLFVWLKSYASNYTAHHKMLCIFAL